MIMLKTRLIPIMRDKIGSMVSEFDGEKIIGILERK
jgi:hypothetical protein